MQIIEVNNKKTKREFLLLPVKLYKNDKNWIRPLDKDVENVFDRAKNKYFRHGECIRWILIDDKEQTIGRVAAFINKKTCNTFDQPTGGMGFFECINDSDAAFKLFATCKGWLEERGMEAMDGPVNFGDRDRWWGLLVDGFTEPNYCCNYNFPYYKELFESYGFKVYFRQYTYHRPIKGVGLHNRVMEKAEKLAKDPNYEFKHISIRKLAQYAEDFRVVYNKAWVKHGGVKEMSQAQSQSIMKKLKPVLDKKLLWYGYYKGEPIAFFLMLPDLNQIFKYANGKLNWLGKIKFLYHKYMKTCKKIVGIVFGVVPEHQGKGVEGAIIVAFSKVAWSKSFHYTDLEMNWIGDFNPKMMRVCEQVGGKIYKTHHTYRLLFDPAKEFKRAPIMK